MKRTSHPPSASAIRRRVAFYILCLATLVVGRPANAQLQGLRIGTHLEQNSSLQPGLELSYDNPAWLKGHPRFTLSYSTTRLATATGSNGLVKDRLLIASAWYFRPTKRIDPYLQLELGYARFNLENAEIFALLDNDAPLVSVLFGLETRWLDQRAGVYGDFGFSLIHSSTVYPFVASIGVNYKLHRRTRR